MNLIRQLLLLVEDQGHDMNGWIRDIVFEGFTEEQISHHLCLLIDGGFVTGIDLSSSDGMCYRPRCLTWRGHEFLSDIRDRDVWETTLKIAKKGGAGTLTAVGDIAKTLVKRKLDKIIDLAS